MRALLLATVVLVAACKQPAPPAPAPVRVAAAADLSSAFDELGKALGEPVVFSFGSSGQLEKQVEQGAPFDVFAAANVDYAEAAVKAGACEGLERYARGRLAVFAKAGAVKLEELGNEKFQRIAIANPETAPYGRAAKQALQDAGLWERVEQRIVYGENVRQTLQLAQTGNVDAALVADALVVGSPQATLVDEARHQPLVQGVVRCKGGANAEGGKRFVALLRSEQGLALMKRYGFEPP